MVTVVLTENEANALVNEVFGVLDDSETEYLRTASNKLTAALAA